MKLGMMLLLLMAMASCMSEKQFKENMRRSLKEDPKILTEAIEENYQLFFTAMQNASRKQQLVTAQQQQDTEKKQMEESFRQPFSPQIRADEAIRGNAQAPLLLIMYSDFQCPYCSKGYQNVKELQKIFGDKIKYVYKHLPLDFHPQAMFAAQYFEAIRLQSNQKAFKFHDLVFENQGKVNEGEKFFKELAQKAGADMKKLVVDLKSDEIKQRIKEDSQEAAQMGMQGTPGFLLNGIPVRGAYPVDYFVNLVDELKKRGKVTL
ncbi:MAG: thioredoxin domain-containing protein [Pseudomonadota bacterium]